MRVFVRLMPRVAALVAALTLSACGSMWDNANNVSDKFSDMMSDFNPFGTGKKPLPGERRAVFPEGVPGVQQGVPQEFTRPNPQVGEAPPQPPPQPAAEPPPAQGRPAA